MTLIKTWIRIFFSQSIVYDESWIIWDREEKYLIKCKELQKIARL